MLRGLRVLETALNALRDYRAGVERVLNLSPNHPATLAQLARLDATIDDLITEMGMIEAGAVQESKYDQSFLVEVTHSPN